MNPRLFTLFLDPDTGGGTGGGTVTPAPAGDPATGTPGATTPVGSLLTKPEGAAAGSPWTVTDKGTFADGWLDNLPADFADSKQMLANLNSPDKLAKSYIHAQRMLGKQADAVLVPTDKSTPEEVAAFRQKLGIPDSVEKYATKIDGLPEGVVLDETGVKAFNELAHKSGLTPTQAAEAVKFYAAQEHARTQASAAAEAAAFAAQQKAITEAWGDKYDQNKAMAERMAQSVGLPLDTRQWTPDKVVIALERAARFMSEDKLLAPDSSPTFQVGKVKAQDIMRNPQNPQHQMWVNGDPTVVKLVQDLLKNG